MINKAAQQLTDALTQSFRATADRTVGAQEQGTQLTQDFFNRGIENLHTRAGDTRQIGQQLADQQQRAQEARQQLTQESAEAYMGSSSTLCPPSGKGAHKQPKEASRRPAGNRGP